MSGWRVFGRIVALLVIAVFVPLTATLLLAFNAQQVAAKGEFLGQALDDPRPFESALSQAADDLARAVPSDPETRNSPIARLDRQDWETILGVLLPPDELQAWARGVVVEFQDWLRYGEDWTEDVIVPFGDIRDNMVDDPAQTVLRTVTEAQPTCAAGQSPLNEPLDLIPSCRPDDPRDLYQELGSLWTARPDDVWDQLWPWELGQYGSNLSLAEVQRREGQTSDWEIRSEWRWARWGLRTAGGLLLFVLAGEVVILLGLVALLAARNWPEALRWVGVPLAVAGLFAVGLGLMARLGASFGPVVVLTPGHYWLDLDSLAVAVLRPFGQALWDGLSYQGGLLTLIGVMLWFSSLFIPAGSAAPHAVPPTPMQPVEPAAEAGSVDRDTST